MQENEKEEKVMPTVGDKKFGDEGNYTEEDIKLAQAEAKKTGQKIEGLPTQDAGVRSTNYQLGGAVPGNDNFGMNLEEKLRQQMDTGINPSLPGEQKPAVYEKGGKTKKLTKAAKLGAAAGGAAKIRKGKK
jgi:hypothetical protein